MVTLSGSQTKGRMRFDHAREFTTALRSEFTSNYIGSGGSYITTNTSTVCSSRSRKYITTTQYKRQSKTKDLTGVEMVEKKRKRLLNMASEDNGLPSLVATSSSSLNRPRYEPA